MRPPLGKLTVTPLRDRVESRNKGLIPRLAPALSSKSG